MENNEKSWEKLNLRILHVGINANGDDDAHRIADQFETLLGFTPNENPLSIFSSPHFTTTRSLSLLTFEVMEPAPMWLL